MKAESCVFLFINNDYLSVTQRDQHAFRLLDSCHR